MSVKTMGLVWDLDNSVIEREEKFVLLAYTDHADHNGENMFPSIALICQKTGYKERACQMITKSLVKKGFLILDGKGPKGTNKYKFGGGAIFAGVQNSVEGGAKNAPLGVQTFAPEPSEPSSLEPSIGKPPRTPKATSFPELVLYRSVTEKYPPKSNWNDVIGKIALIAKRLGHQPTVEDLFPFYSAWTGNGWNQWAINWLDYAVRGELPTRTIKGQSEPKAFDAVRQYVNSLQGGVNVVTN